MANKHKGEVSFEHDGETYTMRYGMNALQDIEDVTGLEMGEFETAFSSMSAKLLKAVVWAGLRSGGRELSLLDVGDLIDDIGLETVSEKMNEALLLSFPKEAKKKVRKPRSRGTGKSS